MDNYDSFKESIKADYGFAEWAGNTSAASDKLRYRFLPSVDKIAGFNHEERVAFSDGGHAFMDYYLHQSDPDLRIAVTIIEYHSVQDAHDGMIENLCDCMAPNLPKLERIGIKAGDIGFGGHEDLQTGVMFTRFNVLVKVNSVGKKDFAVKDVAEEIDRQIIRHHQS